MIKPKIKDISIILFSLGLSCIFQYYASSSGIDSHGRGWPMWFSSGYYGAEELSPNSNYGIFFLDVLCSFTVFYFLFSFLFDGFDYLIRAFNKTFNSTFTGNLKRSTAFIHKPTIKDVIFFSLCLFLSCIQQLSLKRVSLSSSNKLSFIGTDPVIYSLLRGWPTPIIKYSESAPEGFYFGILLLNILLCMGIFCFLITFALSFLRLPIKS